MKSSRWLPVFLAGITSSAVAQNATPLLVSADSSAVVLRWTWPEGERPAGYFVERRAAGENGWIRLNATQPLVRNRDRAAARAALGTQWPRYEGLLFPDDPRAEHADPESYRGMLLLAADVEPAVAQLLGLRYEDRTAQHGVPYSYRLVALTSRGEVAGDAGGPVTAGRLTPVEAPGSLQAAPGTSGIALRWDAARSFSAFHVYRSDRRSGAFAPVNTAPVVVFFDDQGPRTESAPTFFTDLSAPRGDSVFYRVAGVDAFGRESRRSEPVGALWRDPLLPAPPPSVQARALGDTIIVTWIRSTAAAAYQLWTADNSAGPFQKIGAPLPMEVLEYRHAPGVTRRPVWYRVTSLDAAGQEGVSSPMAMAELPDLVAPPVPALLVGTADTARLRLDWPRVAATDLVGYRVYRSRSPEGTLVMLFGAPRADTTFTDTIPASADQPFFYRVSAVDSAFNESAPSLAVVVRPPDVTAPGAPSLTALRRGAGALTAEWLGNPEPDVVGYRVLFRSSGAADWLELPDTLLPTARSATIAALEPGRRYDVSLIAVDDAGNRSLPAAIRVGEPSGRPLAVAPDLRRAAWDGGSRAVVLEWVPLASPTDVLVLRREQGGSFRPVGSPDTGATRFADASARPARRYEYALSVRDAAGAEAQSRTRGVTVPGAGQ